MAPEEEYILVRNHRFLLTNMPADEVKEYLYQEMVINLHQLEEIEAANTHKAKNEKNIEVFVTASRWI